MEKKRSRWDETPALPGMGAAGFGATPAMGGALGATPAFTPGAGMGMETPSQFAMTPDQYQQRKVELEMDERNR